jgi:hypothetical protein
METDPYLNECLAEVDCGPAQVANLGKALNIVLVLDASAAMKKDMDGVPLAELIQRQVLTYTASLPLGINLAVVTYGGGGGDCGAAEVTYGLAPLDPEVFQYAIDGPAPVGDSPVAAAMQAAMGALAGQVGQTNHIILLSTSGDTCGTDLCALAERLPDNELGVPVRVYTIGLGVNPETRDQVRCLSDNTGGIYYEARSIRELELAWELLLQQATQWARSNSCMAPRRMDFSLCLSQRSIDLLDWALESGLSSEQRRYVTALRSAMRQRIQQERRLHLPPTSTP